MRHEITDFLISVIVILIAIIVEYATNPLNK